MAGERFRITNYEALTRKHRLVCTPPREVKIENVLLAIGNIIGSHHIRAASRMDKKTRHICLRCAHGEFCCGTRSLRRAGPLPHCILVTNAGDEN